VSHSTRWAGWTLAFQNRRMFTVVCALLVLASVLDLTSLGVLYVVGLVIQGQSVWGLSITGAAIILCVSWAARAGGVIAVYRSVHSLIGSEEARWRERIVGDAIVRDISFFHLQRSGEMTNAALNEARLASSGLIAAATAVQSGATLAGILAATLIVTPWIWLPLLLGIVAGAGAMGAIRKRSVKVGTDHMRSNRKLANVLSEIPRAMREIKLFRMEARVLADTGRAADESSQANAAILSIHHEARATVELVFVIAVVTGAALFREDLAAEPNLLATMLFLAGAAGRAVPYLTRISSASHQLNASMNEMASMARVLEGDSIQTSGRDGDLPRGKRIDVWTSIEVRDVAFSYGDGPLVVEGVNFTVEKEKVVIFFGPSGGGKSTLLDLLADFMRPTVGTVSVDGEDLTRIDREDWFAQVGYVPQFPYVFFGTIRENLRAGGQATEEALDRACERSGFDAVLAGLSDGYETIVGEGGIGLSGGQKQKLALARTLLREPTLLLLDEPTSAMDGASRDAFSAMIASLRPHSGIVIASHSTELTALADETYRVGGGQVVRESPAEQPSQGSRSDA